MRKNSYFEEEKKPWNYYTNDDVRRAFLRKKYGPIVDAYDMGQKPNLFHHKGRILYEQEDPANRIIKEKIAPALLIISVFLFVAGAYLVSSSMVTVALGGFIGFFIIVLQNFGRRTRIYELGIGYKINLNAESFYPFHQILAIYPCAIGLDTGLKFELPPLRSIKGGNPLLDFMYDQNGVIIPILRDRFGDAWGEIFHEDEVITDIHDLMNPFFHIEKSNKRML